MSEHEHDQKSEETSDEPEETMKDLDVPDDEATDVAGGRQKWETPDKG